MRQFFFVVAMVGAAFLGGAVVNGPGLHWVQARLLDYMGLKDGGEIASIDLPPAGSDPADPHRPGTTPAASQPGSTSKPARSASQSGKQKFANPDSGKPASPGPASPSVPPPLPVPTAIPEPVASKPVDSQAKSSSAMSEPTGSSSAGVMGLALNKSPELAPAALPGLEPPAQPAKSGSMGGPDAGAPPEARPAPLDPGVGPALLASRSPSGTAPDAFEQPKPAPISLEPAPATLAPSTLSGRGTGSASSLQDWAALRSKMQSLGVTRYTIEGEPGGRRGLLVPDSAGRPPGRLAAVRWGRG